MTNPVVQWNRVLLQMVRTPGLQPATIHATRNLATMHAAIYDAVNAIDSSSRPYAIDLSASSQNASPEAAAIAAAHEVLIQLYPGAQAMLDLQMQQGLSSVPDGAAKTQGLTLGQTVADRILALRTNDGSNVKLTPYVFGMAPGDYQSTPPNFPPQPQFTHWPGVMPFAIQRANQFRPEPPPALTSSAYADAFNEIKPLGVTNSTTATADQALAGQFWNGAIQNYWNEISQTAALNANLNTTQSARLFALLNLSLADTVIAFYDAKYTYNLWRPVTAIRSADTDGNPNTAPDPAWLPEVGKTAADPSYPGAHAALSAAGAFILDLFFGGDQATLKVTSEVLPGVERSFTSFSAAAQEATLSRIYAGQHFRFDLTAGQQLGRAVAEFVGENLLTVPSQPHFSTAALIGGQLKLSWSGQSSLYSVQRKSDFLEPNWTELTTTTNLDATVPLSGAAAFFRVVGR
jgi:membrane-associated phospholipid phosphatase